jgi:hypothetical protein
MRERVLWAVWIDPFGEGVHYNSKAVKVGLVGNLIVFLEDVCIVLNKNDNIKINPKGLEEGWVPPDLDTHGYFPVYMGLGPTGDTARAALYSYLESKCSEALARASELSQYMTVLTGESHGDQAD